MMPEFAKSLFGFGSKPSTPTPSQQQQQQQQQQHHPPRSTSPSSSNLPTATNSRAASVSGPQAQQQAFAPATGARTTTALSTGHYNDSGDQQQQQQQQQPVRGRLKVRVIEARGLRTPSAGSRPYVICTFDSSEFISHAPAGANPDHPSGIAIPQSRQSSSLALSKLASASSSTATSGGGGANGSANMANPTWRDEAIFDVTTGAGELEVSIYDAAHDEKYLGHARLTPELDETRPEDRWLELEARVAGEWVTGQVRVSVAYERVSARQYGPDDFEVLRLVGKGTFGQVYQVRKKDTQRIYAMKVLSKKAIVQKKEVAHTIGERNILVRTTAAQSAFIVGLKFSFQTPTDLYFVTDYMSGGELFWHLQKEGRFKEERAKFYIAELIVALENLHDHDVVYRDLKPENVLLDANGHVALCDFGLSKVNPADGKTNTFCGTTEYLAPEVLLDDKGYTKMVDFWSLGVLVFEMCCGWSPFYDKDNQQMYKNIAFGKVRFPKDALSAEGRNFVKGLLNRNPKHRLGAVDDARELRRHPFFADIDWDLLMAKKIPPPFKPHVTSETDTSNFDPEFTQASTSAVNRGFLQTSSTPLSPGIQANFQGFTYVNDSSLDDNFRRRSTMQQHDGDIDLYDDQEIQNSYNYYNLKGSELVKHLQKYQQQEEQDDDDGNESDGDVRMMDDDDFVNGQRFEL
ncbi:hypothetical protein TRICI_005534 [Trichomonascus ciferrii]|uniref:Serine/threonine-protein kinase SCH9 n=1 Tax=Trichomonascus ciferrii TaxID=44093 RepID=A0A642US01_9ASCO|nr:hypothetical protein TRICI_005534 [Trichomonascus ciferrii]